MNGLCVVTMNWMLGKWSFSQNPTRRCHARVEVGLRLVDEHHAAVSQRRVMVASRGVEGREALAEVSHEVEDHRDDLLRARPHPIERELDARLPHPQPRRVDAKDLDVRQQPLVQQREGEVEGGLRLGAGRGGGMLVALSVVEVHEPAHGLRERRVGSKERDEG
jgi:hypothetical protein